MTERLKLLLKLRPLRLDYAASRLKKNTLQIKGLDDSSSEDSEEENKKFKFDYGRVVQNTQLRDNSNVLDGMYFNRAQTKNVKTKRNLLEKVVEFKHSLSPR